MGLVIPAGRGEEPPDSQVGKGHASGLSRGGKQERLTAPCPAAQGDPTVPWPHGVTEGHSTHHGQHWGHQLTTNPQVRGLCSWFKGV